MAERSPNPSAVDPSGMNRRQVLGSMAGLTGAALLAACGSSSKTAAPTTAATTAAPATTAATTTTAAATTTTAAATTTTAAATTTTAAAGGGKATGTLTWGSNYSDAKDKAGIQATADAFPNKNVQVKINTVDHNTYQDNISTYLQQPDDIISWFAGYRLRFFAAKGLVGDISDIWKDASGFSDAFKSASTGDDGKQYLVPFYYYPWAVHYRKSFFAQKGYTIPKTWDEFMALMEKMKKDGVTPLAAANDGKWPQMGMFDQLNMRTNGFQFHVDLMAGKGDWTSPEVAKVFTTWKSILPYYQDGVNGRTWQNAANDWAANKTGMYLLGTFVTSNFKDQAIIDDIDFFPFPSIDPKNAQDAVEAPIDGFMMAAKPKNPDAAKEFLAYMATAPAEEAYLKVNPSSIAANSKANTADYTALQKSRSSWSAGRSTSRSSSTATRTRSSHPTWPAPASPTS